jgi:hypothetical protein
MKQEAWSSTFSSPPRWAAVWCEPPMGSVIAGGSHRCPPSSSTNGSTRHARCVSPTLAVRHVVLGLHQAVIALLPYSHEFTQYRAPSSKY